MKILKNKKKEERKRENEKKRKKYFEKWTTLSTPFCPLGEEEWHFLPHQDLVPYPRSLILNRTYVS
jgi:hypothetical protein